MKGDTNNLYIPAAVTLYKVVFKNVSNVGFLSPACQMKTNLSTFIFHSRTPLTGECERVSWKRNKITYLNKNTKHCQTVCLVHCNTDGGIFTIIVNQMHLKKTHKIKITNHTVDLKTRKSTGASCQISQIPKWNPNLVPRACIPFGKDESTSALLIKRRVFVAIS